jgi:hypothetical protein
MTLPPTFLDADLSKYNDMVLCQRLDELSFVHAKYSDFTSKRFSNEETASIIEHNSREYTYIEEELIKRGVYV